MKVLEEGKQELSQAQARFQAATLELMESCKQIALKHGMTPQELWTWILVEKAWEIESDGRKD